MRNPLQILGALALAVLMAMSIPAPSKAAVNKGVVPVGGKYRECHGYVLHISAENLRVHCIDGTPADLSFISFPHYAIRKLNGKTIQDVALKPGTPVHVIYTRELGLRHAYKVYVANPHGQGLFGFKS